MSDTEFQPLKGNPTLLRSKARHYASIADAITRSVTTLRKVHDADKMKSKAVDQVRDSAEKVANDIDKARDRYRGTADALITYSYALETAQSDADTAISHISDKQTAANSAHTAAYYANQAADDATDDDKSSAQRHASRMEERAGDADAELDAAKKEWHDALDKKNTAAKVAIDAIVEVVDGDKSHGLNDSWWDNWGSKLYKVFKTICDWAGVLSIFLGWVPVLGQILIVLGTIGAVLDLIDSVIKAITEGGSWKDVLFAAGGVALSFVGGKAFAMMAKHIKSVAALRSIPKALKSKKAMTTLRKVMKVKKGESAVPALMKASKFSKPKGVMDVLKNMFKGSLKGFVPSNMLKKGMSAKEAVSVLVKGKIIPNIKPSNILKLNQDFMDFAKLVRMNPALLKAPEIAVPLVGVAGYQAYQSYKGIQGITSPSTYINSNFVDVVSAVSSVSTPVTTTAGQPG